MRNVEARLAQLEQLVEAHANREGCNQCCGPDKWYVFIEEADGLHTTGTKECWPVDGDGHALCRACGRRLQYVITITDRK